MGVPMDYLGEFQWVVPIAAFFAAVIAILRGYTAPAAHQPPRSQSTIHGATIMDSAIGNEAVVEIRRIAVALESILLLMQDRADQERQEARQRHDAEFNALRREIEDLKRGKR